MSDKTNTFFSKAIKTITRLRLYQYYQEGATPEADALLDQNQLCIEACYLACPQQLKLFFTQGNNTVLPYPPEMRSVNYPSTKETRLEQLARAASLISREIDRLNGCSDIY
jgi:hypothetical protein